jgi:hypothetical protein
VRNLAVCAVATAALLAACGSSDDEPAKPSVSVAVPRVKTCAAGGSPEVALQGQVPASMRSNFAGFSCNLALVGQFQGEGADWSQDVFKDRQGHACAYQATLAPLDSNKQPRPRTNPGVPVIDITNPTAPVRTVSLTTASMLDPWESLRVSPTRALLLADNAQNGGSYANSGGPEIDIYDISGDCRAPQLLASVPVGTGSDGGILATGAAAPTGHEGAISRDGLTYYVGDATAGTYRAIDITDTAAPKLIAQFNMPGGKFFAHGLSISDDGNRIYVVDDYSFPTPAEIADPNAAAKNGFLILDSSEVQSRKPGAALKLISSAHWRDGSTAQHTLPFITGGRKYLAAVDETGSGGFLPNGAQLSCDAKLPPFSMARIYDISDEANPVLRSKLMLETHDPVNCAQILPDIVNAGALSYGSHYCSVDNRENATAMACAYFNSGVRVFDIRDPSFPKEIAYFNPRGVTASGAGSGNGGSGGKPDRCTTSSHFDFENKTLTTTCQDNGLLVLKFADNTWPFPESTPSTWQRN